MPEARYYFALTKSTKHYYVLGGSFNYEQTTIAELPYINDSTLKGRGKVLAVVTSTDQMGSSGKSTGYELTELSRAYYVFKANGFEVDICHAYVRK